MQHEEPLRKLVGEIESIAPIIAESHSAYRAVGQFKLNQPDANPML